MIAGLGQGWLKDEFETSNVSFLRRGSGMEDYIGTLRAFWGPDPVHYQGRYYTIPESDIGPKPFRPTGFPILIGAVAPASLERAARLGDGLTLVARNWDSLELIAYKFPEMVRQADRDPQGMLNVVRANFLVGKALPEEKRPPLAGSFEQVHADMQRLQSLGFEHVFFDLVSTPVSEHLGILEPLRRTAEV